MPDSSITAEQILQLLNLANSLAPSLALTVRELITSNGYDIDKLLSAGKEINDQTLTHVENEIKRVQGKIAAEKIFAIEKAPEAKESPLKGGDPKSKK